MFANSNWGFRVTMRYSTQPILKKAPRRDLITTHRVPFDMVLQLDSGYLELTMKIKLDKQEEEPLPPTPSKNLIDYFSWRQPYRGDELQTSDDVSWVLRQIKKSPEELAVLILEIKNERDALLRRIQAISAISSNSDFIHDATQESVEWAFGQRLKKSKKSKKTT